MNEEVPTGVRIRSARADDVQALTAIYLDAARHHAVIDPEVHLEPDAVSAAARVASKLGDEQLSVFVAVVGDEPVAMLEIRLVDPAPPGSMLRSVPTATVGIAVRKASRGQGIGTALMRHAEAWTADRGRTRLILDMSAANTGALRFYERLGYRTYGLLLRKDVGGESTRHP